MSFWNIISTLLLGPLELIFETIFTITNRVINNPGLSIVVLSLMMNILVLPLYKRADAMQEEERLIEEKLDRGVRHIKKTFKGDEKMMMLQTYYRQNDYKPTYVLRGAVSLFLEIPFFMAAYRFLSGLRLLDGVSFGPIADLGSPDGLIVIGGIAFNLLPVIMTAVNLVSCAIFTKGSNLKSKLQLYGMAVFFLFFLYTSPAGLVFYWTLNNIFSLVKTIFYKIKNPRKVLSFIVSAAGIALGVFGVFVYDTPTLKRTVFFAAVAILSQLPLIFTLAGVKLFKNGVENSVHNGKLFLTGCLYMAVFTGALIPSAVIKASPQEFFDSGFFYNPIWYVVSSLCLSVGAFVIWAGVFYRLVKPGTRALFDKAIWVICVVSTVGYMFFGKGLGNLSSALKYENGVYYAASKQLVNILIIAAVAVLLIISFKYIRKYIPKITAVVLASVFIMSVVNVVAINKSVSRASSGSEEMPLYTMSKNGKNVVVIMLDRAIGEYIPFIMNEKPELKEKFDGFTYYSNTLAFGANTNFAAPAIFGGYEYSPVEMNKRSDELLKDKHNEALKVMPVLFDRNGYSVTVFDPSYANYEWIPDLSIYDEYPNIKAFNTKGKFTSAGSKKAGIQDNKRNFFCYSMMRILPLALQTTVYDHGNYNISRYHGDDNLYYGQTITDNYHSVGINESFMNSYNVLSNLSGITAVSETCENSFLMMVNEATHEFQYLQEGDYVPSAVVDNTAYEEENGGRYKLGESELIMNEPQQFAHYQTNMGVLLKLGEWFDYLRENGVYDNTRIILVSDHSGCVGSLEELMWDGIDFEFFFPLLMVKDFGAKGFVTSDEFMTNGDVPVLATDGVIESAVNLFTGKELSSSEKSAHDQYVVVNGEWDVEKNNGNTFLPAYWYKVRDNVWDRSNWELVGDNLVVSDFDQ